MTTMHLAVELVFVNVGDDEQFEAFLDSVMDELDKIGYSETNLAASLTQRTAEFVLLVKEDGLDAAIRALGDLQAALHAANIGTANWPDFEQSVTLRSVEIPNDLVAA
jgi:hypothetical protein